MKGRGGRVKAVTRLGRQWRLNWQDSCTVAWRRTTAVGAKTIYSLAPDELVDYSVQSFHARKYSARISF
jgi:hypothetical protein